MQTSEVTNEIAAALAKAQGAIENPTKDSQNPHFKSFYADLSAGINAIRDALAANSISYVQATRYEGDVLILETRLTHSSGQWMQSEYPVCKFPAKQQEIGSSLTYARRYSLFGMVGIAGEDDDGNEANKSDTPARSKPTPRPPAPPTIQMTPAESAAASDRMADEIMALHTPREVNEWALANSAVAERLLPDDYAMVKQKLEAKKDALRQAIGEHA